MTAQELPPLLPDPITAVRYIEAGPGRVKVVVSSRFLLRSELRFGDETWPECRNRIEPYDFLTHVFFVPESSLRRGGDITFLYTGSEDEDGFRKRLFTQGACRFRYGGEALLQPDVLYRAALNGLKLSQSSREPVAQGVTYVESLYHDRSGLPVRTFALLVDTKEASFAVGTPEDGYQAVDSKQDVIGQMQAAISGGRPVIAAVNGDFFDMFGDFSPSGPCVKDGRRVWAGDETRPVLGLTSDGSLFIGDLSGRTKLVQAVGGMPQILADGKPRELLTGEPFGDLRHPRTAVGLGQEGLLILLVVDGRIPEHSNGASLGDLAGLMEELGAREAMNLDGGGSAILVLNRDSALTIMNRPADLIRPKDNLVRDIFNSVLVVGKGK